MEKMILNYKDDFSVKMNNGIAQWDNTRLNELKNNNISLEVGQTLLFENEQLKVWSIRLNPQERIGFHKHSCNYTWTALTEGYAISYYADGSIFEYHYVRGDMFYYDYNTEGAFVHDLMNIGSTVLMFNTVEYK